MGFLRFMGLWVLWIIGGVVTLEGLFDVFIKPGIVSIGILALGMLIMGYSQYKKR